MADESKVGTPWEDDDLDVIVTDYFDMLAADLSGAAYVKSHHCVEVMRRTGRTHRSVEFKHQNISAVMDEIGLPWIPGYIPKRNYQNAIFCAIDRYLSLNSSILLLAPSTPLAVPEPSATFVPAPLRSMKQKDIPKDLQRLVRKFDPVERDHRNRALGTAGESFVFDLEKRRLTMANRSDLARKVRWVANEDGDGAGYDIFSFAPKGCERLIEVKTTNGAARTPFFLSRNECELANERQEDWLIYRVHLFAKNPRIFTISPPLDSVLNLRPETYRASF